MLAELCPFRGTGSAPSREVRDLAMVVAKDYERRAKGERPDRMHWADAELMVRGWYVRTPSFNWLRLN